MTKTKIAAGDSLSQSAAVAQDKFAAVEVDVEERIKKNPWGTVAVAGLIGLLIGSSCRRQRHTGDRVLGRSGLIPALRQQRLRGCYQDAGRVKDARVAAPICLATGGGSKIRLTQR